MKVYILLFLILAICIFNACQEDQIPELHILKESEFSWDEKENCKIVFTHNEETDTLNGEIKFRGGMSSKYFKHSFSLELDDKFSFPDLPKDDDWIINANYIDKTFMRHKISFDLFREMSEKNIAAQTSYINVKVNNKYEGLYVLMEKINGGMVELEKQDTMAMIFKEPPIFKEEKEFTEENASNYYDQKFPKINYRDKTAYLEEFKTFLFHSSDEEFSDKISEWIDIENVIDWNLLLLFSNNSDGIMKNFYLYKIDASTPFRIAIWDYDHSFGRDGDNEKNMMERELDCKRSVLIRRLMEIESIGYSEMLASRWKELRENDIFSIENFKKHIQKNDKIIRKEIKKNAEVWPLNDKWYYDDNSYQQELDLMIEFVEIRLKQLDESFKYKQQ